MKSQDVNMFPGSLFIEIHALLSVKFTTSFFAALSSLPGGTLQCMPWALILNHGVAMATGYLCALLILILLGTAVPWQHPERLPVAAGPPLEGRPFTVVWNMPTAHCKERYGIDLDLTDFDIIENHHEKFLGQNMTIFYHNKLGLYPYLSKGGDDVNGGIPQRGNLRAHLGEAKSKIEALLLPLFHGLAVIDWEEWRPLWVQNFGKKRKYQELSKELVREEHPELSGEEVTFLARKQFNKSARDFLFSTLQLGVQLRPAGSWGFYGLPSCPNYHKAQSPHSYTGHCHPKTTERNDRLDWLWGQSTALYPSIYLPYQLAGSSNAALMVRFRVLEALRVAAKYPSSVNATPVLPYARVAFAHTLHFLNKMDLEHTLGESAALGTAGVVLWGELQFAKSKHQCKILHDYVGSVLGKYVRTLKRGVQQCSHRLCSGNGRCARRNPDSGHMMHSFSSPEPHRIHDSTFSSAQLRSAFHCLCYQGWTGELCQDKIL
ncbi:hyaluronidase-3 [Anguilla rostrata]|uniref:hyaluronidase-3 n=1 Tax=Anguilla rostrata TaxID=7938 RepID=UPI0030D4DDED